MTKIKGLYVTCNRKPGKPVRWYVYAWRGGPLVLKTEGAKRPNIGPKEIELYHKALKERQAIASHTIAKLVQDYRNSREWKAFADSTRRMWGIHLDRINERWGKSPIAVWSDPRMVTKVIKWRDENADQPRKADYGVGVLRSLLEWARLRGLVKVNVAVGIPQLYHGGQRAEILWTQDDIERFCAVASQQVKDGLHLACHTGLRRADLVKVTWDHVGPNAIIITAEKKSKKQRRKAVIPITRHLRALLTELETRDRKEGVKTILVNGHGKAWSGDGFGQRFNESRDEAGIAHDDGRPKHLHDCRGTFATRLILAGFTDQQAADVLAWSPERVANIRKVYVDQERVIVEMADRLNRADCQPDCQPDGVAI